MLLGQNFRRGHDGGLFVVGFQAATHPKNATTVLPLPTSPWIMRSMGRFWAMSALMSAMAFFWRLLI